MRPRAGNFVVKDSSGVTTLLQVQGTGPVAIPGLATAPVFTTGVCFNPAGVLGQCASSGGLAGPTGATGPAGATGPTGATGATGAAGVGTIVVGPKTMTLTAPGFTSLASWTVGGAGAEATGGYIGYTIVATDGASQIATETGTMLYNATANSITCTVQTTQKLHLGTVNSGCTPGFFNPGSQPGVSIFDNVAFGTPAPIVVHYVYFEIHNVGAPPTRLEP